MHCASLGEFEQGKPLLEAIKKQYPTVMIVLSFFSPSGFEVQKNYPGADAVIYLPMDSKANAQKLISTINPSLVLWVKYEYWFYYLEALQQQKIPVLLVSGIFRNSQPFFKWYGGRWKNALNTFSHFFVQDQEAVELLSSIGINQNIANSGDTRFDRVIDIAAQFVPLPLIEQFCGDSQTIVAGSTWETDEVELIHFVRANPHLKFIIAPHQVDKQNIKDVQKEFAGSVLYSSLILSEPILSNTLIIDNVGMLSQLYHYASVSYIGGGFGKDGVHNVLEAAVYGKPVIYGPEFEKFIEAAELINCAGAVSITNALELEKVLNALLNDDLLLTATGAAAKQYVYANAGASKKIMDYIQEKRLLTN